MKNLFSVGSIAEFYCLGFLYKKRKKIMAVSVILLNLSMSYHSPAL